MTNKKNGLLQNLQDARKDGAHFILSLSEISDVIDAMTRAQQSQSGDAQTALEALDRMYNDALASQDGYGTSHDDFETIRAALTSAPTSVKVDLDKVREVFEDWLTARGDYPHLKHKSFGGNYINEEAAMKWEGFKTGYYSRKIATDPPIIQEK